MFPWLQSIYKFQSWISKSIFCVCFFFCWNVTHLKETPRKAEGYAYQSKVRILSKLDSNFKATYSLPQTFDWHDQHAWCWLHLECLLFIDLSKSHTTCMPFFVHLALFCPSRSCVLSLPRPCPSKLRLQESLPFCPISLPSCLTPPMHSKSLHFTALNTTHCI